MSETITSEQFRRQFKLVNGKLVRKNKQYTSDLQPDNHKGIQLEMECLSNQINEKKTYFIEINPNTKPRMTRSDKWKTNPNHSDPQKRQRKPVTQYFRFKDELRKRCRELNIDKIPASIYTLKFYIKMPDTWSNKKKKTMNGKPHQQTPDIDNLTKAFFDSLEIQDNYIAEITNGYGKYWSERAGILLVI